MSIHRRVPTSVATLVQSISSAAVPVLTTGARPDVASWSLRPLQLEGGAHITALVGMIALALLGGVLVARNRYRETTSFVAEPETHHEEFVTDRERVRRLLQENDGRMKQSAIVDSVDWSKAKVSRLLADLEEDDQITKLRLGRENLVCLPGHEPTASKSPEQANDD